MSMFFCCSVADGAIDIVISNRPPSHPSLSRNDIFYTKVSMFEDFFPAFIQHQRNSMEFLKKSQNRWIGNIYLHCSRHYSPWPLKCPTPACWWLPTYDIRNVRTYYNYLFPWSCCWTVLHSTPLNMTEIIIVTIFSWEKGIQKGWMCSYYLLL